MMDHKPGLSNPEYLQMPLRDVARGLMGAAHLTKDALAPVVATLPSPLQSAVSNAMTAIKSTGVTVMSLEVTISDIATASRFMTGAALDPADATTCAKVIAFAWDHLNAGNLASETIIASHLSQASLVGASSEARAAALLLDMADSTAFGRLPGIPLPEGDQAHFDLVKALVALTTWLLAEREETLEGELHLLELANALSNAFGEDIRSAMVQEEALPPLLNTLSSHL